MLNKNFIKADTNIIDYDLKPVDLKKQITNGNLVITRNSLNAKIEIADNSTMIDVKVMLNGNNNNLIIEEGAELIDCSIYAKGDHNTIYIGKRCKLKGTHIMCCDEENSIIIGEKTTINGEFWGNTILHTMEKTRIEIGKDCMLSGNIVIRTTDGHSIINSRGERINLPKDIKIDNHVWIGMNCMILKGTHIVKGCIVGANSVVTHSFNDDYTMIAGNPAKKISKIDDFDWNRRKAFDFTSEDYRNNIS